MSGVYTIPLVVLSVGIAIIAAYASIELAARISMAEGRMRSSWLVGGAVAMGTGIWAIHYVGMIAFRLPIPIYYHLPTVLLSMLVGMLASFVGLVAVSSPKLTILRTLFGGTTMGGGIATMHYVGMASIRVRALCHYSPLTVCLSVVAAVVISCLAVRLIFSLRGFHEMWNIRKAGGAFLLGITIPIMHYIGMGAAHFEAAAVRIAGDSGLVSISRFDLFTLVTAVLAVLALAICCTFVDRHLATQASELALSQQQLQDVFDNMADAFVVLDVPTNTLQANRPAMELLGIPSQLLTREEARSCFELFDQDNHPIPFSDWPLCKAIEGEFWEHAECIVRRRDTGAVTTTDVTTRPVLRSDGSTRQVFVCYRDVTDRKQNSDSRARLAAIVDCSEDAILSKDRYGIIRSWNSAAERIFGYTTEEMVGQSIMRLVPTELHDEELDFLERLSHGEIIDHVETMRRHKSGRSIHVSLTISPIRDAHGRFVGSSKIVRDITERKMLERQLARTHKMQAIGELTGGIAHDFNNLLGVIVGNLSLIEGIVLDGAREGDAGLLKRVRIAEKAAARGADLTRRLLTFSSTSDLNPVSVAVKDVVQEALELASRTLGPDIRVTPRIAENLPPIFIDPSGLESALLNLMVNARDAMPRGGTISVLCELVHFDESAVQVRAGELRPGSFVSITVTDAGVGMSAQTLERALEPFFTTKPRGKGTGLGLPMVYGFARQSGGTVRIYSEVGHGTSVTLYLRLAQSAPIASCLEHEPLSIANAAMKVLVVDDEPELLEIAVAYLRRLGIQSTYEARNGAAALDIVRAHPEIELVITDVIMPGGINGAELVEHIRQYLPAVKVIYSSGFPADALAERSGTAIDGHLLRKPYQRAEFEAAVRHVLESTSVAKDDAVFLRTCSGAES